VKEETSENRFRGGPDSQNLQKRFQNMQNLSEKAVLSCRSGKYLLSLQKLIIERDEKEFHINRLTAVIGDPVLLRSGLYAG
jgi:hypothetical protein